MPHSFVKTNPPFYKNFYGKTPQTIKQTPQLIKRKTERKSDLNYINLN
jgi:hypothetical protein